MTTVSFEVPEDALRARAETADQFLGAMRVAAAMYWYGHGDVSLGTAAAIAGMSIKDFLFALSEKRQDIFPVDLDEIDREMARG